MSNRGDNSVAIFKVLPDGHLEHGGLVPTGGKFPRHFAITPDGEAVIVANQDSGDASGSSHGMWKRALWEMTEGMLRNSGTQLHPLLVNV